MNSYEISAMIHKRYGQIGPNNQRRYLIGEEVRLSSFDSPRIADVIVQDTWAGGYWGNNPRMYPRHGFEIKVSRSDWLNEVKQPDKAEAFRPYCHFWYLAIADKDMVKEGELPKGWGLLVPRGKSLAQIVAPEFNAEVKTPPPGMLISLMRRIDSAAEHRGRLEYRDKYFEMKQIMEGSAS